MSLENGNKKETFLRRCSVYLTLGGIPLRSGSGAAGHTESV